MNKQKLCQKFGNLTYLHLTKLEQDILVEASASMEMLQDYIAITDAIPVNNFEPEQLEVLKDVIAQLRKKCSHAALIPDEIERRIVNRILVHEGFDNSDGDLIEVLQEHKEDQTKLQQTVLVTLKPLAEKLKAL